MGHELTINTDTTVETLIRRVAPVHEDTNSLSVLALFHENKKLYALPVVNDKNRPVGIILRQEITEFFSKPFSKELKGKKSISKLMDNSPIIVDRSAGIEDVARIVLDAGIQHMISGFIITKDKQYLGMANGYDLLNEITKLKQKHLFGLAHFDQLTGLPNRTLLLDRLKQSISISSRASRAVSLLFIDLDGFKHVNDTYGHTTGDKLLKEVATRLLACIREGDTAARMGGDEFVVLLIESDLNRGITVAERILLALKATYNLGKKSISSLSASIGIAEFPDHASELQALIDAADKAMYVAKKSGKDQFAVFMSTAHPASCILPVFPDTPNTNEAIEPKTLTLKE
ncbi:MAG: GGDEF domain-containing protein [Gallionella sp.]